MKSFLLVPPFIASELVGVYVRASRTLNRKTDASREPLTNFSTKVTKRHDYLLPAG